MDLLFLFRALLKRKWIILGATMLTVIAAFFFVINKEKLYESIAQYSTGFTVQQVSLVNDESDAYKTDIKFNNVLQTFTSPKVIGMLSYNLMLHDLVNPEVAYRKIDEKKKNLPQYTIVNPERAKQILQTKIANLELLTTYSEEDKHLIEYLKLFDYDYLSINSRLFINRIPRTDYLTIVFRSENPNLSAYVVNKLGDEFLRFYNSISSTRTSESVEKISGVVDQKKREVDSITERLRREKSSQGALNPADLSKSAMETVKELNSKLADEESSKNKIYYQLRSVQRQLSSLGTSSSGSSGNNSGNNYDIVRIKNRIRELSTRKDDPQVSEQISKLQDELNQKQASLNTGSVSSQESLRMELSGKKADLEEELNASDVTVRYLNSEIRKYASMSNFGAGSDVTIDALRSEVDIANREYSAVKSKYMEAEGAKETPNINFKQTLVGQPAVLPEPSYFILTLGVSGISMLALSSLLFILLEIFDSSIKTPSHFANTVGLKLLSVVNRVDLKNKALPDIISSDNNVNGNNKGNETLFKAFLRKLRFEIERSGKNIILFTSTKPGEGKTTIIEALACSVSLTHKKVLIIDSNFPNNTITQKFGVTGSLEKFQLNGHSLSLNAFKNIINASPIKNVDIIGSQGGNYTPTEVLDKNNVLDYLEFLSGHYDYIFLEGASLNDHSDTKELSKYAQGIICVFSSDSVFNQMDKESIQFLNNVKQQFIGCVLNKVDDDNINI